MNESKPPPDPETTRDTVPRRTTPTWEMELLLSGATVFTLWQIAAGLAPFANYLLPRLDPQLAQIGGVLYIYLASGVIMIGLAFMIHLVMRAYWVALVGMHSVFPQGLRLDRMRGGPITREHLLARWEDMDAAIERADNRATIVFGLGLGVAGVLIPLTLIVLVLYGLAAGIGWLLGRTEFTGTVFLTISMLAFLPYFAAVSADRWLSHRMAPSGLAYRACASTLRAYSRMGLGREANPLVTLYTTNVGERRGLVVISVVMLSTLLIAAGGLVGQRMELGPGSFRGFPAPWRGMPATMDGRHYASMHEPGTSPLLPYLPDPVARGDYLRLVVPYVPARQSVHLTACTRGAGAEEKAADEAPRRQQALACFARGFELAVDGEVVAVAPDWYSDPRHDVRGLVYMVPVQSLAPGRHELRLTSPDPRIHKSDELPPPDLLPFWR